jgi:gentisate 1,2-dioxygenase
MQPTLNEQGIAAPSAEARQAFYDRIGQRHLAPLWEVLHSLVTPAPTTNVRAHKWSYDADIRPHLMEAGALITAAEAERRVLILENPGMPGEASITQSLYAGFQLVLPGEAPRAHRHSQSALRLVVEGAGAYSSVDGERILMNRGDLVITPAWSLHDHGNETHEPMIWIDGLDIPLVRFFDAGFLEAGQSERQEQRVPIGDGLARFGANLAPVDWTPSGKSSPLFSYPYVRSREVLDSLARSGDPHPNHGYKLRYLNPANGKDVMPTIGAYIQLLPPGLTTSPSRSTGGAVYLVLEGAGSSLIGDTKVEWKRGDVFVAPSWAWQRHRPDSEAVLFSFSDRPVLEALDLWREELG